MGAWEEHPNQTHRLETLGSLVETGEMKWEEAARDISSLGPERTADGCRFRWYRYQRTDSNTDDTPPAVAINLRDPSVDWDQWVDTLQNLQGLVDEAEPIYTHARTRIETDKPIVFQAVSDLHLGSRFVCYKEFRQELERTLSTPRIYWGMHGDDIEGFDTSFRNAFPVLDQLIKPSIQRALDGRLLDMLHDDGRLLYGCAGTAGHSVIKTIGEDLIQKEYQRRHVPYFVGKGIWTLEVGEQEYVFMLGHQLPGTSIYNPNHAQVRSLLWDCPVADFIISGHTHRYSYQEISHHELAYRAGVMPVNRTHMVNIGTAKTGPDPYSISRWSQGVMEFPQFVLYPDRHIIKRVSGWEDINHFLEITDGTDVTG